ncbi:Fic/DOC family protein [Paenibacillus silvae]|uniref:protein adenylyltransferase n=1 Tax=Paenibacillus silvae TaxID=1325358 RepID=A0A2W6NH05_9BACL|nr:Fic family protein [Paenibacillus silvae]PZT55234.1 cell filamentation protein Fic [Paenibacillus silvae]
MYEQSHSKYCYPNSEVLINVPGFKEQKQLDAFDRILTMDRLRLLHLKPLKGNFDRFHLCNIHKFLFEDIYPFAGSYRTEEIGKGSFRFANVHYLVPETDRLLQELKLENFLINSTYDVFTERLAYYLTELNVLHPFREGNGRTQREFIRTLALESGYHLDFTSVKAEEILQAMIESPYKNYKLIDIFRTITKKLDE